MEPGLDSAGGVNLNQCLEAVAEAFETIHGNVRPTVIGNVVRVHLAQTVLLSLQPSTLAEYMRAEPQKLLASVPKSAGRREQMVRFLHVGRRSLCIWSLMSLAEHGRSYEIAEIGSLAYSSAANSAASFDRWWAEIWWTLSSRFEEYSRVVGYSAHIVRPQ